MSQAPGPGSERIGGVHVDVTANVTPLKAGLKQAEAEAQAAAAKMAKTAAVPIGGAGRATIGAGGVGMGAGAGVSTIGKRPAPTVTPVVPVVPPELDERKGKGIFASVRNMRTALSRILFPAIFVAQAQRIATWMDQIVHSAAEFNRLLKEASSGPAAELLKTLREVRLAQGLLTAGQIEDMALRERGRETELAINAEYQKRILHLHSISGLLEALSSGQRSVTLLADAERKYNEQLAITRHNTEELVKLNRKLREETEELERVQRRMREQAKRDITHTTIDTSRIGPALDLLQRQRTAN